MEENVISMFMDVKLDIRERKLEFSHLKSWTRYFVRVEAVKCFPCYIKISFFKSHNEDSTDLIVRINIPGLTVQMATSRTRAHIYGLFWKNNRKRCCAYFALPSQLLCERHLRWMKKSIRNLELYRQEILQLRRASRTPMHEIRQEIQPDPANNDLGIYQNLDITQNMADVHDILGPLPNVPDQFNNISRRISSISGIYEEIFDPTRSSAAFASGPRMSIASGIYEEMKLTDREELIEKNIEIVDAKSDDNAPPLPPRPRSHTNEFELQRSFTTPEVDFMKKKKHWPLFESMFGRRRTNSGSASIPTSEMKTNKKGSPSSKVPSTGNPKVIYREKITQLRLMKNKRNSFSSPDLSLLKVECETGSRELATDNLSDEGSCSSEFYIKNEVDYIEEDCFVSSEFLNRSSIEESMSNLLITGNNDNTVEVKAMNVSEQIVENFNSSCNTSTVNLVGFNCTMAPKEYIPSPLVESVPVGYCEMGAPGTGFNRLKLNALELSSNIETGAEKVNSIYMNMNSNAIKAETSRSSSTSSGVSSINSNRSSICSSGKPRNSVDDKISSYYPNEDFRSAQRSEKSPISSKSPRKREESTTKSDQRIEGHYVTMSSSKTSHRKCTQVRSSTSRYSKSPQKSPCTRLKQNAKSTTVDQPDPPISALTVSDISPTKNSENNPPETTPTRYQKYATIARSLSPSSSKYQEKNSSNKRFGSLPRFGKIDLSPLRLKINSVLQRHTLENL
ncbi:serine-rich adhesin for platelets [Malaya genurostris]|uniref:serine-rich adhesin for platelets n=1 Tax=Malaya genurostris TaxID=325434 RepID=UPI0026F39DEA|nr:serine-rich adhesin for platelets [Malaya genurostris]XP_058454807.1 serine-rich adhesin for platelets [Malaya genurostris]